MTQPRVYFLVFGTLYGSLIGHGLGMWIGTSQLRLDDQPVWGFWMMVLGMGIGLIVGVLADARIRTERSGSSWPGVPNAPKSLSLNARLLLLLIFLCVCYLLIWPALNVARE